MRIRGALSKWRRLAPLERRATRKALWSVPLVRGALRWLGFRRAQGWLGRATSSAVEPPTFEDGRRWAEAVDRAARAIPGQSNCLDRSLCLWWLLRRQGRLVELRIGVRKSEGTLEAHAWVESNGRPLNDFPDVHQRYAAFEGALLPERISP